LTTYDNLNQWFDDVKKDILTTGLVVDKNVFDAENGALLSEVWFKRTQRDDSLIWMRLSMTLASLATRVVLALSHITTQCSSEEQQEESNQQGM
jgi:hypothetical protein